ncbi:MAG: hypothetical protein ACJ74G_14625 [Blastocatellia bacterium]
MEKIKDRKIYSGAELYDRLALTAESRAVKSTFDQFCQPGITALR